ncbi:UDP-3-O-(3-hydroxymyristoyl)glucosamine N-acyltransferase [Silanimonas sp.]|uniref:UDP-3-O-(3-hydroxymyristoyl)glucosamine N-acyltransferase n=1 Tax=Silanimonas sp. TaxID=1929290 RepID=UPI0022CB3E22|nr:UDP-3-O-(3-hydroxymyristoyl)glucosamine N-acyltransferase [Silanimonas sp.]MCZ8063489.1 UDP-3-O-(3-hydroxymyristoyl)glucosamine N-acyltransferase [Silanimonas sp.]
MEATTPRFRLSALAERFGLEWRGEDAEVYGVAPLQAEAPPPGTLAFLANPAYRKHLAATRVAAVVLHPAEAEHCPVPALLSANPYATYARIAALFERVPTRPAGVHASADIDPTATVDPTAHIGAFVSVGARSVVAAGAMVGAGSVIGEDCVVGAGSELVARVTLVRRVRLGERVRIHPGAVLGADGFGLAVDGGRWINVPQLGGVVVGDDCEIGANTTIDRGAIDDTVLEEDVRLDNQIQIGHNVRIGAHTAMAGCVAVAGSTRIGRWCLVGGAAGIIGHLEITDKVTIGAMSLVTHSLGEPGEYASGTPLQPKREWRKNAARFGQLDRLARILLKKNDSSS